MGVTKKRTLGTLGAILSRALESDSFDLIQGC